MSKSKSEDQSEQKPKGAKGENSAIRYSKAQLLGSKQYTSRQRDILIVILSDTESYTHEEAQRALQLFLNKGVR
ncbi:hypothetical protein PAECIP111893_03511 [Paenibacillus plantiphilus]|uniref:Uncharacterized protein n=1 Tax=Paenibacillus plantiphilus TaxID=2905650 RepID=A0ABN8GP29_9BACL|nr:hypothetical protein [Paenibacillus plantiphilus]CAH1212265.1 hypothetical protein PAECIP111893_03511 [Paenibacillus plantiphilus]